MYCTNCGKKSQKGNEFCTFCGEQLDHRSMQAKKRNSQGQFHDGKNENVIVRKKGYFGKKISVFIILVCSLFGIAFFVNHILNSITLSMDKRSIGENVSVSGEKVPIKIKATEVEESKIPIKRYQALGPEVDISPGGSLAESIILTFKLNKQIGENDIVVIARKETPESEWTFLSPEISEDGQYATITTNHLSIWRPLQVVIDLGKEFKQEFINSLTGGYTETANKPTCQNEEEARKDGYAIESSHKDTLYWCFGIENGKRVLKVVNRKRYPLDMIHPGLTVQHPGDTALQLRQLARLVSGEYTILFPHDEAIFLADLQENQTAGVRSDFSWNSKSAIYLEGLQTSLDAVSSMVFKSGLGKELTKTQKYQALNLMMESKDCTNAIAKARTAAKSVDYLKDCLGAEAVEEQLGDQVVAFRWMNKIMSPLSIGGSLVNWFAATFSGYIDEEKERSDYYIMITRGGNQTDNKKMTTDSATIDITGKTIERNNNWPCPEPTPGGTSLDRAKYEILCGARMLEY